MTKVDFSDVGDGKESIRIPLDLVECVVPINPKLPPDFDNTPNDDRPPSHRKWWYRPYIVTETVEENDRFYAERTDQYAEEGRKYWETARAKWLEAWPSGTRYEVRCLDGGAWDRSTNWGMFASVEDAIACAGGDGGYR